MDNRLQIWEHTQRVLEAAEQLKWNPETHRSERDRSQGVSDALRAVLILLREDPDFAELVEDDWKRIRGTTVSGRRTELKNLCPLDGSILKFNYQDASLQKYTCPENDHVWCLDWRGTWSDRPQIT